MSSYSSHKKPGQKYTICSCLAHPILAHRAPSFFLKKLHHVANNGKNFGDSNGSPLRPVIKLWACGNNSLLSEIIETCMVGKIARRDTVYFVYKTLPSSLTAYITSADVKHSDVLGIVSPITNNLFVDYDHTGKLKVNMAWWNTKYY